MSQSGPAGFLSFYFDWFFNILCSAPTSRITFYILNFVQQNTTIRWSLPSKENSSAVEEVKNVKSSNGKQTTLKQEISCK